MLTVRGVELLRHRIPQIRIAGSIPPLFQISHVLAVFACAAQMCLVPQHPEAKASAAMKVPKEPNLPKIADVEGVDVLHR